MIGLNTWDIFAFIGFIFLVIFFFAGKNLVWAAFSIGIIIAVIISVVYFIKDGAWPWELFKKTIVVITFAGILIELSIRFLALLKRKRS